MRIDLWSYFRCVILNSSKNVDLNRRLLRAKSSRLRRVSPEGITVKANFQGLKA